jgi:hypothetical protein
MRSYGKFVVLLVFALSLLSGFALLQAQDDTAGTINCDSDLLLNLTIAERFFGFGTFQNQAMTNAADPSSVLDLDTFNRGQFGALHDTQQTMLDPIAPNYGILTEEQFNNVSSALEQDEASFDTQFNTATGFDTATGTTLNSSTVAGEVAECATLRTQLNRFFRAVLSEDLTSGMMIGRSEADSAADAGMTDTEATAEAGDTGSDATPEATPAS